MADSPEAEVTWLTAEALAELKRIQPPHVAKKRATVILLASAIASETPQARVFEDERACNQRVWYQKWQYEPEIATALEFCIEAALDAKDTETARIEAAALQQRRRAIAAGSIQAVTGLQLTALQARNKDGIEASKVLIKLADPELATRLGESGGQALAVEVAGLDALIDAELARVAGHGESRVADPVADQGDELSGISDEAG